VGTRTETQTQKNTTTGDPTARYFREIQGYRDTGRLEDYHAARRYLERQYPMLVDCRMIKAIADFVGV